MWKGVYKGYPVKPVSFKYLKKGAFPFGADDRDLDFSTFDLIERPLVQEDT
jgi:hypothetical protein